MSGRVGVLVSGRGSNLQALMDAERDGSLGGEIVVVISNVGTAQGLERARCAGITAVFRDHRGQPREAYDAELLEILTEHRVDLVCLAGYMRLISPVLIRAFASRILNVHPSLLPAFPGLEAQRQAVDYGAKVSGATVHFVDEGLDSGPVVAQEAVRVEDGDSPQALASRILDVEHRIYPAAVRAVLGGRYRFEGRRVLLENP